MAVNFVNMKYERVDIDRLRSQYDTITKNVREASDASAVFAALEKHTALSSEYETMATLTYLRHTIDTRDEFYAAENDFYDETGPLVEEKTQEFFLALYESPYRKALEEKFGELMFDNLEIRLRCFDPSIIAELQEENRLVSEYGKLTASAQIEFDGKVLNLSQLGAYRISPDREVRKAATYANGRFFADNAEKLDDIYDRLVKLRTAMAKKLGYDNFLPLAYDRRQRNCYDAAMVKNFREQVKRDIVPIVVRLKEMQAERIGISDMKFWDDTFSFKEGNPKPIGTPEDIMSAGRAMYHEMSKETGEFIDFMFDNGLCDLVAKPGKSVGGYCTFITGYKSPFIFSNFNGTSGDVDVLTHEAGHAFAAYCTRDITPRELAEPTVEACEVHSMSMEMLTRPYWDKFYGDDTDRARFNHLADALIFLPYGCMVDEFQHMVYENPDASPSERCEMWKSLEAQYRPYLDFADIPCYSEGRGWQRQLHIYELPFYYIDYCLAQTTALEFWALAESDRAEAWKRYTGFVDAGGRYTYLGLCEKAGMSNVFEEGAISRIAGRAKDAIG